MRIARYWMKEGALLAWFFLVIPFGIVGIVAVITGLMVKGLALLFQAPTETANLSGYFVAILAGGIVSRFAFEVGLDFAQNRRRRLRDEESERKWAAYRERIPSQREVAGG